MKRPVNRRGFLGIMGLLSWFPRLVFAGKEEGITVPPARAFAWDLSRAGSTLVRDIRVKEFDRYDIILAFGDLGASNDQGLLKDLKQRDDSWRNLYGEYKNGQRTGPLAAFLGSSSRSYFRKSDNTLVISRTAEERAQEDAMRQRGELVSRPSQPGTVIPVRLHLERLDGPNPATLFDAEVATAGDEGGHLGFKQRFLARGLKLDEGRYRLTATALQDTQVPAGLGCYIAIPLRDWTISRPKR